MCRRVSIAANVSVIVQEAARIAVRRLQVVRLTSSTMRRNLVTTVDEEVQKFLSKKLLALMPDSRLLSEEGSELKGVSPYLWIVDPIDGTSNLYYGNPHFAVSVALTENEDVVLGVVCDPMRREVFTAEQGKGALLNGKRVSVGATRRATDAMVSVGIPYQKRLLPTATEVIRSLVFACRDIRRTGSSALDICYVACGRTDGHVEIALSPWDVAAASIILAEAGGRMTDWNATSRRLLAAGSVLAANSVLHSKLAGVLKRGGFASDSAEKMIRSSSRRTLRLAQP